MMASTDQDTTPEPTAGLTVAAAAPPSADAPVKRAAKRAPRQAARKRAAPLPAEADAPAPDVPAPDVPAPDVPAPDEAAKPAARKRASRKSATPVAAEPAAQPAPSGAAPAEPAPAADLDSGAAQPGGPGFGLLFRAPDPTAAPRRRATAPAAAPVPADRPDLEAADATDEEPGDETDDETGDETGDGQRRRRRRGGKGRRGRGGDADGPADVSSVGDTAGGAGPGEPDRRDTEDEQDDGGGRRRTRRRRRTGSAGSAGDPEEAPGVVTRVREPRRDRDDVTGLRGSTRLEAKKQRRREGREAGRRRTVITEAEFLARRESVERVMVVRNRDDRTQIAVLEDGVLVEHYISRETNVSMAGNIYLGRVQNVLPSMEAAFVDIGKGRNAVLYAGEVNWDAAGLEANQPKRIEHALSSGQAVLVQVTKDPIGHKGARLTSQISLPGRYLVYVPDSSMTGISRKLPDTERARLKKILREVVPETAGVIVRTAAEGASEEELRRDVERLTRTWEEIRAQVEQQGAKGKGKNGGAPTLLHGEPDLSVRVIRDVFNEDFSSLIVAGEQAWTEVNDYVTSVAPDLAGRLSRWTSEEDLFTRYRVDEQISKAMDRKVWLPSGGSLVIDRTEAMTVVDVNTGKFVGSGGNLEETVTKNNIEAAEEIVRQLRLRDIGGIIVIDFIDMVLESNRELVVRRLLECLGRDRTKHQVAEVTSLGLVQMTRKRVGSGLIEVFSETCEHCNGRGIIVHTEPVDRADGGDGGPVSGSAPGSQARGQRARRGRGNDAEQQPSRRVPGGPTPAQIAAAAHAAAVKSNESAHHAADLEILPGDTTGETGAPDEVGATGDQASAGHADQASAGHADQASAGHADQEPEPPSPAARQRRRRGRVVAPAGPPRSSGE